MINEATLEMMKHNASVRAGELGVSYQLPDAHDIAEDILALVLQYADFESQLPSLLAIDENGCMADLTDNITVTQAMMEATYEYCRKRQINHSEKQIAALLAVGVVSL